MLQNRGVDLNAPTMQLQALKSFIKGCRSDERFEHILGDATGLANELEIPSSFDQESIRRKNERAMRRKEG